MKATEDKPTAECGAELTQLRGLTSPRVVRSTGYHFFLHLLYLFHPQCGEMVLNLKYESCFLTSEIFFNSPSYTHTHARAHTHKEDVFSLI